MKPALRRIRRRFLQPHRDPLPEKLGDATLISMDPARIALYGETPARRRKSGSSCLHAFYKRRTRFILPGRWDLDCVPFRELERYRFIEELRRYEFDYTKCERFQNLIETVKRGKVVTYKYKDLVLRSEEDIHAYLQGHVEVCKSMLEHGYIAEKARDHICVMVGRRGDLIKEVRGLHRLAIAQVFGVDKVVALVRRVHSLWVKSQIARTGANLPIEEMLRRSLKELERENQPVAASPPPPAK